MPTPNGGTMEARTLTASGSVTPSRSSPSANREATLLTGPPKSKAAMAPMSAPKTKRMEPRMEVRKSVSHCVAHTIGTPMTKNMSSPITSVLSSGRIIMGMRPWAQRGTRRRFLSQSVNHPTRNPPSMPPRNPAPMAWAMRPMSRPGAMPGRSAIE